MAPKYYHTPSMPTSTRRCPICHEVTYSREGIHPQCAVRLSDPPRPKPKPPAVAIPPVEMANPS